MTDFAKMRWFQVFLVSVCLAAVCLFDARISGAGQGSAAAGSAQRILDASEVTGGVIVHLGCGDGQLTTALYTNDHYVVQGLDANPQSVQTARQRVKTMGIYGPVSIELLTGDLLPYSDGLVNLLVVEDSSNISKTEMMRVLAPGGVLCTKQASSWKTQVKPRPTNTDEWTHYMHDSSGNPVAHDEVVAPPRAVQWVAGPRFARSHEHLPSIEAVVSSNGRIFYIADEGSTAEIIDAPRWNLVARDAYNGVLLWQRPIASWFPVIINWGATPRQLQRKLVAVGDHVYVTLGLYAPLSLVDAVTGQTLKTYAGTDGAEEIVLHQGVLLLAVRSVTKQRVEELAKWAKLAKETNSPLFKRDSAEPLVGRLKTIENRAKKSIMAVDASTGKLLWKKTGDEANGLRPLSLCAGGQRVFYQNRGTTVCVDLKTGKPVWKTNSSPLRLVNDDIVVCADGKTVTVRSAATGEAEWSQPTTLVDVRDAFVVNDSVWVGGFRPCPGKRSPVWGPYFAIQRDRKTGKLLKQVEPENPSHHHRCYLNKATDRYILGGRRGIEFIDVKSGDYRWNSWVRGVCKYGVMPSNGLVYSPPNECGCYIATKLAGFYALSGRDTSQLVDVADKSRFVKGPAYKDAAARPSHARSTGDDWPTYRHDAERSGRSATAVATNLAVKWTAEIGGKLSPLTIADGRVYVANVDHHAVSAIDARSGKTEWQFTAGARVDSPPTIVGQHALFGSRDGCLYSVRTSDGLLAWRRCLGRNPRQVVAQGQLEAASPVPGSVLVQDGIAYVPAGRSSYLDGGIDLYRIDPGTGGIESRNRIYSPDPKTGKQPAQFGPAAMPGERWDILSGDNDHVYLRDMVFDLHGQHQETGAPHLLTLTGFLDDAWVHRSYWIFGTKCSLSGGCSGRARNLIYGRLLVFDDATIYGYGRKTVHWSNAVEDGPYRMFAVAPDGKTFRWQKSVPIQVHALVMAGDTLFVAGPRVSAQPVAGHVEPDAETLLLAISAKDGKLLMQRSLGSRPVFDGLAAANRQLYIALKNGQIVCLGTP